jgi:hypothetical protein
MAHSQREFRTKNLPLAYLISFRVYGTWLHGDRRGSVDRFHNRYGSPRFPPNEQWRKYNLGSLKQSPVKLGSRRRAPIKKAIRETCKIRRWPLLALNALGFMLSPAIAGWFCGFAFSCGAAALCNLAWSKKFKLLPA